MKSYVIYVQTAVEPPPTAEELADLLQSKHGSFGFSATPPKEKV